jgi:hypothetical protein
MPKYVVRGRIFSRGSADFLLLRVKNRSLGSLWLLWECANVVAWLGSR